MPTEPEYGQRAEGSALSGVFTTLVVVGAVIAGFIAWHPAYDLNTLRRLAADTGVVQPSPVTPPTSGEGTFEYAMTQPDGTSPVGFDPCRAIDIVVNPQGAPEGYADMVDTSVRRTSEATGLTMSVVGETSDRAFTTRGPGDPVVVAWADSEEVPELAGDVRGLGGSTAMRTGGTRRYVSGIVVIDTDSSAFDLGGRVSQAILDHEFGHLVGLGHVDDAGELMNPTPTRLSYGPGDLEGLASLGRIECA
ncbi:MAG: hypothetical protein WA892_14050 [Ornithinimicrobium sp.]